MDSFSPFGKYQLVKIPGEFEEDKVIVPVSEGAKVLFAGAGLTEDQKKFAVKVASALDYSDGDCAFLEIPKGRFFELSDAAAGSYELIVFTGVDFSNSALNLKMPKYSLQQIFDTPAILTDELETVGKSREKKMHLWGELKKLKS